MALIVEVLDRPDTVRMRVRLGEQPLTIGRGYDNDVILDDAYVDARHCRISIGEDGTAVVEDLGSINGLIEVSGSDRVPRVAVRPGSQVRVGRTVLRFRDSAEPLPPALVDVAGRASLAERLVASRSTRIGISVAALMVVALSAWLESYDVSAADASLTMVLGVGGLGAIWAAGWALASRVTIQRFHYWAHFAVFAAIVIPVLLLASLDQWLRFLLPGGTVGDALSGVAWFLLFAGAIALHLRFATHMSPFRRWRAGILTGVVIGLIGAAVVWAEGDNFTDVPEFDGILKAYGHSLLRTVEVEEFGAVVTDLTAKADAALD